MRLLILLVLLIILGFFSFQRLSNPQLNHNSVSDRIQHPLDTRLRYRIGQVDPRFQISEEQLKKITQEAADIWLLGTGQQYFVYDPNAQLTINLIYDQRQAESDARRSEMSRLENSKSMTDAERQKLRQSESELDSQQHYIEVLKSSYQTRLDYYNQQVQRYNQSQQKNQGIRDYLENTKQQLQNEQAQIQQQIDLFNANVARLNQHVDQVNAMNDQFNASVDHFNTRFQPRQFDKGLFNGREINIYEFQNLNDLKITLAHELGHGLGLLHTNDPESLMYPMLEKQKFQDFHLRAADIALLNAR